MNNSHKWVITLLTGIITFLLGGYFGDLRADQRIEELAIKLSQHEKEGHQLSNERINNSRSEINNLSLQIRELNAKIEILNSQMSDNKLVLNKIYNKIP